MRSSEGERVPLCPLGHLSKHVGCFPGTKEYVAKASGNVSVQCQYSAAEYGHVSKAWCKEGAAKPCIVLVDTKAKPSRNRRVHQQGRVAIQDDTRQGIITVTMEKLQAQDSGVYWCALYEQSHLTRMVEVVLNVSEGEY